MAASPKPAQQYEPATLYGVIKDTIGKGLQDRYRPANETPHDLLVLLMQINDEKRPGHEARAPQR